MEFYQIRTTNFLVTICAWLIKTCFHNYSPSGRAQLAAFTALQAISRIHILRNGLRLVPPANLTREIPRLGI